MKSILLFLAALASGVVGGMGMGGGTLLIPILTLLFKTEQNFSQTVNLVAFVPMAIIALIIHFKNGVIKTEGIWVIILSALALSIGGSFLAKAISGNLQTKLFGVFLALLSIFQFIMVKRQENTNDEKIDEKNGKKGVKDSVKR